MENLLPVIVGGIIGLAGGLAGPPLRHWLNEESNKKNKKAEKLEEMIGIIYSHEHWLSNKQSACLFGKDDVTEPSPLPQALAIAVIYFPQFSEGLSELDDASRQYIIWMLNAGMRRLKGENENLNQGFEEAYSPYLRKRNKELKKLQDYAGSAFA